jgi:hypothetical protein
VFIRVDVVNARIERTRKVDEMSKYLILIFQDEANVQQPQGESITTSYQEFMQRRSSSLVAGAALERTTTATSVRPDDAGGFVVTDGPFAESKEALGGYFLIEAADLDEALQIAKEVPTATGVEVRPVRVVSP